MTTSSSSSGQASPAVRVPPVRRLVATLLDYVVILVWMTVLGVGSLGVYLVRGSYPDVLGTLGAFGAQAVVFVLLTFPVSAYLYLSEAGAAGGTWGKRRMGLVVRGPDGGRPSRRRVVVRTAVKLLPWEVAHAMIWQMQAVFYSDGYDAHVPVWIFIGLNVVNIAIVVYIAMSLWGGQRGPHDRVAGTRITVAPLQHMPPTGVSTVSVRKDEKSGAIDGQAAGR